MAQGEGRLTNILLGLGLMRERGVALAAGEEVRRVSLCAGAASRAGAGMGVI